MIFVNFFRERKILSYLRALAGQRVAMVLQPGNVWVIENAPKSDPDRETILLTCQMRGWVEPMMEGVPHGQLTPQGELPSGELFSSRQTVYRLTDCGWNVVNRQHQLNVLRMLIALVSVLLALNAKFSGFWNELSEFLSSMFL